MKFKNVAYLYMGCKVKNEQTLGVFLLSHAVMPKIDNWIKYCKPLLYPLSAMTNEYMRKHIKNMLTVNDFKYLLDNHYDLFNLIEQGEAIDVTTLDINPYLSPDLRQD